MMSKINLTANKAALENAWSEVTRPESKINWAVFGYDGKTFNLKVIETGEDGFEEMADELSGGKIMYAVCRVNDPNTNLPKIVFVNWQGEGVPANIKGVCANHLRDVTNFFKGCHVTINARSDSDLEYDSILDKVKKSSGANYSFHKEKPKPVEQIKPVGAVYKKVNPIKEINVSKRDSFWSKQEEEERARVVDEKHRMEKQKEEEEKRRKEREAKEADARDQVIRERTKSIEQQRATQKIHVQKQMEAEKERYKETMKEKEKDDQEFRKRSDSERRRRLQEAHSLISSREHSIDEGRNKFTPSQRSRAPPPTKPKAKVKAPAKEPAEAKMQQFVNSAEDIEEAPIHGAEFHSVTSVQQHQQTVDNSPEVPNTAHPQCTKDVAEGPPQSLSDEHSTSGSALYSPQEAENFSRISEAETTNVEESSSIATKDAGVVAKAIFDYQAEGDDEISFDPGDLIEEVDQFDEGWWKGRAPNGTYGIFPANYVELVDQNQETEGYADTTEKEAVPVSHETEAATRTGVVAKAIYDYQAEGDDEISFDPGDLIEEVDQFDEGWWKGRAPNGTYGIFPANYVELVDQNQETEVKTITKEEVQSNDTLQGLCARALYDYQAADDTEISFDPDDIITNIEQIDDGWWKGASPNGGHGLFPANYVELV